MDDEDTSDDTEAEIAPVDIVADEANEPVADAVNTEETTETMSLFGNTKDKSNIDLSPEKPVPVPSTSAFAPSVTKSDSSRQWNQWRFQCKDPFYIAKSGIMVVDRLVLPSWITLAHRESKQMEASDDESKNKAVLYVEDCAEWLTEQFHFYAEHYTYNDVYDMDYEKRPLSHDKDVYAMFPITSTTQKPRPPASGTNKPTELHRLPDYIKDAGSLCATAHVKKSQTQLSHSDRALWFKKISFEPINGTCTHIHISTSSTHKAQRLIFLKFDTKNTDDALFDRLRNTLTRRQQMPPLSAREVLSEKPVADRLRLYSVDEVDTGTIHNETPTSSKEDWSLCTAPSYFHRLCRFAAIGRRERTHVLSLNQHFVEKGGKWSPDIKVDASPRRRSHIRSTNEDDAYFTCDIAVTMCPVCDRYLWCYNVWEFRNRRSLVFCAGDYCEVIGHDQLAFLEQFSDIGLDRPRFLAADIASIQKTWVFPRDTVPGIVEIALNLDKLRLADSDRLRNIVGRDTEPDVFTESATMRELFEYHPELLLQRTNLVEIAALRSSRRTDTVTKTINVIAKIREIYTGLLWCLAVSSYPNIFIAESTIAASKRILPFKRGNLSYRKITTYKRYKSDYQIFAVLNAVNKLSRSLLYAATRYIRSENAFDNKKITPEITSTNPDVLYLLRRRVVYENIKKVDEGDNTYIRLDSWLDLSGNADFYIREHARCVAEFDPTRDNTKYKRFNLEEEFAKLMEHACNGQGQAWLSDIAKINAILFHRCKKGEINVGREDARPFVQSTADAEAWHLTPGAIYYFWNHQVIPSYIGLIELRDSGASTSTLSPLDSATPGKHVGSDAPVRSVKRSRALDTEEHQSSEKGYGIGSDDDQQEEEEDVEKKDALFALDQEDEDETEDEQTSTDNADANSEETKTQPPVLFIRFEGSKANQWHGLSASKVVLLRDIATETEDNGKRVDFALKYATYLSPTNATLFTRGDQVIFAPPHTDVPAWIERVHSIERLVMRAHRFAPLESTTQDLLSVVEKAKSQYNVPFKMPKKTRPRSTRDAKFVQLLPRDKEIHTIPELGAPLKGAQLLDRNSFWSYLDALQYSPALPGCALVQFVREAKVFAGGTIDVPWKISFGSANGYPSTVEDAARVQKSRGTLMQKKQAQHIQDKSSTTSETQKQSTQLTESGQGFDVSVQDTDEDKHEHDIWSDGDEETSDDDGETDEIEDTGVESSSRDTPASLAFRDVDERQERESAAESITVEEMRSTAPKGAQLFASRPSKNQLETIDLSLPVVDNWFQVPNIRSSQRQTILDDSLVTGGHAGIREEDMTDNVNLCLWTNEIKSIYLRFRSRLRETRRISEFPALALLLTSNRKADAYVLPLLRNVSLSRAWWSKQDLRMIAGLYVEHFLADIGVDKISIVHTVESNKDNKTMKLTDNRYRTSVLPYQTHFKESNEKSEIAAREVSFVVSKLAQWKYDTRETYVGLVKRMVFMRQRTIRSANGFFASSSRISAPKSKKPAPEKDGSTPSSSSSAPTAEESLPTVKLNQIISSEPESSFGGTIDADSWSIDLPLDPDTAEIKTLVVDSYTRATIDKRIVSKMKNIVDGQLEFTRRLIAFNYFPPNQFTEQTRANTKDISLRDEDEMKPVDIEKRGTRRRIRRLDTQQLTQHKQLQRVSVAYYDLLGNRQVIDVINFARINWRMLWKDRVVVVFDELQRIIDAFSYIADRSITENKDSVYADYIKFVAVHVDDPDEKQPEEEDDEPPDTLPECFNKFKRLLINDLSWSRTSGLVSCMTDEITRNDIQTVENNLHDEEKKIVAQMSQAEKTCLISDEARTKLVQRIAMSSVSNEEYVRDVTRRLMVPLNQCEPLAYEIRIALTQKEIVNRVRTFVTNFQRDNNDAKPTNAQRLEFIQRQKVDVEANYVPGHIFEFAKATLLAKYNKALRCIRLIDACSDRLELFRTIFGDAVNKLNVGNMPFKSLVEAQKTVTIPPHIVLEMLASRLRYIVDWMKYSQSRGLFDLPKNRVMGEEYTRDEEDALERAKRFILDSNEETDLMNYMPDQATPFFPETVRRLVASYQAPVNLAELDEERDEPIDDTDTVEALPLALRPKNDPHEINKRVSHFPTISLLRKTLTKPYLVERTKRKIAEEKKKTKDEQDEIGFHGSKKRKTGPLKHGSLKDKSRQKKPTERVFKRMHKGLPSREPEEAAGGNTVSSGASGSGAGQANDSVAPMDVGGKFKYGFLGGTQDHKATFVHCANHGRFQPIPLHPEWHTGPQPLLYIGRYC